MYTIHNDKAENFEAELTIEGASYSNTKCRLVLESTSIPNIIFYGEVNENGVAKIKIPKTNNFIKEDITGKAVLEVIADDVFFIPWEDTFEVKRSKSVVAEVKSNTNDKKTLGKPTVAVKSPVKQDNIETVSEALKGLDLSREALNKSGGMNKVAEVLAKLIKEGKLKKGIIKK